MKLRIAQCSPILFPEFNDPLGTSIQFTQHFGRDDRIAVQLVGDVNSPVLCECYDAISGALIRSSSMAITATDYGYVYTSIFSPLPIGVYYLKITSQSIAAPLRSADFEVLDERTISEDLLFEYTNTSNDTPMDSVFIVGGLRRVFSLRLRGGFKPQGVQPQVVQESYRTQRQELRTLYSAPYEKCTLTIGTPQGVPVEVVRLVNNILSCDIVYINGQRWCRSEGATPEKTLVMSGSQMFTVGIDLERQLYLENYPAELYKIGDEFNNDFNNDFDT